MTFPSARVLPFLVIGVVCVVAGGLLSAATASAPSEHTAWATAYLVLVAGVAQVVLGLGHLLVSSSTRGAAPLGAVLAELACWNLGNAAVLAGVLVGATVLVDVGGLLLVVALVLAVHGVRGARPSGAGRVLLLAFRALVVVLLVSIPVGLLLAR
ncbi:MAG TPA: hypothetical protein VFG63_01895 [Nocardioidaceae bacterium]|nr:hypothetical protein [Nocardioidaceae bacterium]